ncbi:MAG: hypothetical protein M3179_14945 [Actinomycetota bacterium]|nr:hypothetical protein [Actinomycetota bacterium]
MTDPAVAAEADSGPRATRWVRESGFLLWFAALAGIGAWMVHITLVSSITEFMCTKSETEWLVHAGTVVTAAVTVVATVMCLAAVREAHDPDDAGTLSGNIRFVGIFGVMTGVISLLLILLEGSYVFFLDACV